VGKSHDKENGDFVRLNWQNTYFLPTLHGCRSYFTQCWKSFPLEFPDVSTEPAK
jgi:hypothetical protein